MKLAITAQGADLDSPVDPRFGRARYFLLVDSETGDCTAQDNTQNFNALQGAGIQAAQNIVGAGAEAVVTGHVGPKAFATLQAAKIQIHTGASGTAREALEQFRAGKLPAVGGPDVQAHWV